MGCRRLVSSILEARDILLRFPRDSGGLVSPGQKNRRNISELMFRALIFNKKKKISCIICHLR
jgi:hypothetical protein